MKTLSQNAKLVVCSGVLLACTMPSWSQSPGFYIKTDLGGNLTQDANLTEFFGPVAPGTKVKFDPGFRAGFAGGFQFCNWFALEGEVGYLQNHIDSITGATQNHDTWLANVPFMVNAKFQYQNATPITPYIGAGVGFSESIFSTDHLELGGTSLHGDLYDTVFAYQAFAGLRYRLNENMGLSVEYHYFNADGASFQADSTFGTATDTLRMGHAQTHAFSIAFDFHF